MEFLDSPGGPPADAPGPAGPSAAPPPPADAPAAKRAKPAAEAEAPAERIRKGWAPVKRAFLRPKGWRPEVPAAGGGAEGGGGDLRPPPPRPGQGKKKSRGQLKRERREAQRDKSQLCSFLRQGNCTYGAACKFNHDLAGYLAQKEADLPGPCPFEAGGGACAFGVACRYAKAHSPASNHGLEVPDDGRLPAATLALPTAAAVEAEANPLDKQLQTVLRKNAFPFDRAHARLAELKIKFKHRPAKPVEGLDETLKGIRLRAGTEERRRERKLVDFRRKLYLAPLTTVGNLPFRRICKGLGADITCGEMAMATNLLKGQSSEWALLRRHPCEDCFGVQIAGGYPDAMARVAQLMDEFVDVDFVDVNMGCPIDLVCNVGAGSALLLRPNKIGTILRAMHPLLHCPLTFKTRVGYYDKPTPFVTHGFLHRAKEWGAAAVTIHGRTRMQRYTGLADWGYIKRCAESVSEGVPLIGNGDIFSYHDWREHVDHHGVDSVMIARGALIKPWIFTEIKEERDWDISAGERLDLLKGFCRNGLEHWGSDSRGVEATRRFLLEWLSYLHRYVPVGLLEVVPQKVNWKPPKYFARNDLETLMASESPADWIKISEMLLGPPPKNFSFTPKHKSNAYTATDGDIDLAVAAAEVAKA